MRQEKDLSITGSRRELRHKLITEFLNEEPGEGTGELCSVYVYYVETLNDGNRVFLKRPARLNKGFDFEVNVEKTYFGTTRKTTMPSHSGIVKDMLQKKEENPDAFQKLKLFIDRTYNCEEISNEELGTIAFMTGLPVDTLIKSVKWLFIEQDMTYWNWSGRNMLYSGLKDL